MADTEDILKQLKSHHQELLMHEMDSLTKLRQLTKIVEQRDDVPEDVTDYFHQMEEMQEGQINATEGVVEQLEEMIQ